MSQSQSSMQQGTQQVREKAQEATDQARESAGRAMQQAKTSMRDQVDERSSRFGDQVASMADDLRKVGKELQNQEKETPARLAEQGADRLESLGSYLKESDGDAILSDIEDFARKQPWVVVAGGITLGFIASRFLKASSGRRYETQYGWRLPASEAGQVTGRVPDRAERSSVATGGPQSGTSPSAVGGGISGVGTATGRVEDDTPSVPARPETIEQPPPASATGPESTPSAPITRPGGGQ